MFLSRSQHSTGVLLSLLCQWNWPDTCELCVYDARDDADSAQERGSPSHGIKTIHLCRNLCD